MTQRHTHARARTHTHTHTHTHTLLSEELIGLEEGLWLKLGQ